MKMPLAPKTIKYLENMGEQIKLARLRRDLPAELIAERAGVSRSTVWAVEKGSPSVSMGAYAAVLYAMNMDSDLLKLAGDDVLGQTMQDFELLTRRRASKR